ELASLASVSCSALRARQSTPRLSRLTCMAFGPVYGAPPPPGLAGPPPPLPFFRRTMTTTTSPPSVSRQQNAARQLSPPSPEPLALPESSEPQSLSLSLLPKSDDPQLSLSDELPPQLSFESVLGLGSGRSKLPPPKLPPVLCA